MLISLLPEYVVALLSLLALVFINRAAVISTTVYVHRCATHGSLTMKLWVEKCFRLATWVTTGFNVRKFVAVHRKHHAHTDELGDPHSPHLEGYWKVQLGNVIYYIREGSNPETLGKHARDIPSGRFLDSWGLLGPALGTLVLCLLLGPKWGLITAVVHAFLFVGIEMPLVNALCHTKHRGGYQHFDEPQAATTYNNKFVAWLTGGEGLHHTHHWRPGRVWLWYTEQERKLDAGSKYIRFMFNLGWVTAIKE